MFVIEPIPCLKDNYAYWLTCAKTGACAVVDPSEGAPVFASAEATAKSPAFVLCTHHHLDHVGGVPAVKERFANVKVYGSRYDADHDRIDGLTDALGDGDRFKIGELDVECLHVPGHTLGAIAFVIRAEDKTAVFTGDTMFLAGCGRLFEGTPADMHASMQRLSKLPDDAQVYCGHEYTADNLRFALSLEPSNAAIREAIARTARARAEGRPTVPHAMVEERAINPFLRTQSGELRRSLSLSDAASEVEVLGKTREAKNNFK